jgi:hypothetical protein
MVQGSRWGWVVPTVVPPAVLPMAEKSTMKVAAMKPAHPKE